MTLTAPTAVRREIVTDPVRVMVVDDSVVIRGLVGRWIDEDPALAVVAAHRNGKLAVEDIERTNPDVVVLDIEMPEMDGLTALPLMLKKKPGLAVIMASTLTRRNAEVSLKALSLGAADYIPKPESNSGVTTSLDFRRDLIEKVKSLGLRRRARAGRGAIAVEPGAVRGQPVPAAAPARGVALRGFSAVRPKVLAIGSSTGGPQALAALFEVIGPSIGSVPVLLTQHMPATFTAILAEHLTKTAGRPAAEARNGEPVMPGRIYVAPGGIHMRVAGKGQAATIELYDGPSVNFCKPAVDPLFDSVAAIYGSGALAVVLTGMGADGAKGAVRIADAGGSVIAQDEATSVVWGMPGATAQAGACSAVLPLGEIGPKIIRLVNGGVQ